LAWRIRELREILDEHLRDNGGELLPHVLMADYERWAEGAIGRADAELGDLLDFLEAAYQTGDPELEELISVSFLEHLPRAREPGSELRELLGPTLKRQLRVIG
jgi:hypothetical protein